ncbi:hypothetical protein [Vibrio aerogenes]|uniref:hypothetical protein n=1 Tax=Vibrio aerogenes TaxID=92172 RepID=UPI000A005836|nr:hypothetical protein [Vibrio aerogenes]
MNRILSDHNQRNKIEEELISLFQDKEISLVDFLDNDECVVYPADDEEDAKEYIMEEIWSKFFLIIKIEL